MMAIDWSADVGMILGYLIFWVLAVLAFLVEALAKSRRGRLASPDAPTPPARSRLPRSVARCLIVFAVR